MAAGSGTIPALSLLKAARSCGLEMMAKEQPKPGRLKVLLGAMRVMHRSAISGDKVAMGI